MALFSKCIKIFTKRSNWPYSKENKCSHSNSCNFYVFFTLKSAKCFGERILYSMISGYWYEKILIHASLINMYIKHLGPFSQYQISFRLFDSRCSSLKSSNKYVLLLQFCSTIIFIRCILYIIPAINIFSPGIFDEYIFDINFYKLHSIKIYPQFIFKKLI